MRWVIVAIPPYDVGVIVVGGGSGGDGGIRRGRVVGQVVGPGTVAFLNIVGRRTVRGLAICPFASGLDPLSPFVPLATGISTHMKAGGWHKCFEL